MITSIVMAAALASFGRWEVIDGSDNNYLAVSQNDSGNLLAYTCDKKTTVCVWVLGITDACVDGSTYPVLINADAGAGNGAVFCAGQIGSSGLYRYRFEDFQVMDDAMKGAGRVGVAFPLQGGDFKVVRFDLSGFSQARADTERRALAASKGSTADITL